MEYSLRDHLFSNTILGRHEQCLFTPHGELTTAMTPSKSNCTRQWVYWVTYRSIGKELQKYGCHNAVASLKTHPTIGDEPMKAVTLSTGQIRESLLFRSPYCFYNVREEGGSCESAKLQGLPEPSELFNSWVLMLPLPSVVWNVLFYCCFWNTVSLCSFGLLRTFYAD